MVDKVNEDDIFEADKPTYDKIAKKFLSKRKLLARILKHLVPEFREASLGDIEDKYIEGDPQVGEVPVSPGMTNRMPAEIRGVGTEQSETAEGWVTFDILFYAKLPTNGETVPFIINIEAQKARPTEYPLMKRVIYYGSRLLSSQKEREFSGMNFGMIQKVYTIWLCFEPPKGYGSGINSYSTVEKHIRGDIKEPVADYQLLNAFVVYIGNHQTGDRLLNLLRLIFKENLSAAEKKERLIRDYDLRFTEEMGEELNIMCNLSEGIEERGIEKGIAKGMEKGIAKGIAKGMAKGMAKGIAKGEAHGKAAGIAEATEKIVRNLLTAKDMTYERIAKATDTSVAEVTRIADKYGLSYTMN